jgi:Fe-S cluster assembly iron-binding protein IscA
MVTITPPAVGRLKTLLAEHPEDPVVRLTLKDLDDHRLAFNITLEAKPQPDDAVQTISGLTVAIGANSAPRLDGITLDYRESDGFIFHHPAQGQQDPGGLHFLNLN